MEILAGLTQQIKRAPPPKGYCHRRLRPVAATRGKAGCVDAADQRALKGAVTGVGCHGLGLVLFSFLFLHCELIDSRHHASINNHSKSAICFYCNPNASLFGWTWQEERRRHAEKLTELTQQIGEHQGVLSQASAAMDLARFFFFFFWTSTVN